MTTVIMRTTTRVVVPLILVLALSLFVRGHNEPGGGFIGAVLATTAFALVYITYGLDFLEKDVLGRPVEGETEAFESRSVLAYRRALSGGLALAVATGLAAVAFGVPFLSQTFVILEGVPLYGEVELASAFVFELGVFAAVAGGLLTVLSVVGAE